MKPKITVTNWLINFTLIKLIFHYRENENLQQNNEISVFQSFFLLLCIIISISDFLTISGKASSINSLCLYKLISKHSVVLILALNEITKFMITSNDLIIHSRKYFRPKKSLHFKKIVFLLDFMIYLYYDHSVFI